MQSARDPHTSRVRRRRLQFSLRLLLMLIVVFAIGAAWMACEIKRARHQGEVATAIEGLGGTVHREEVRSGVIADATNSIGKLLGEDMTLKVVAINCAGTAVTDAQLVDFGGFAQLRTLEMNGTKVSDAGLEHLKELRRLEWLFVSETEMSDAGLAYLGDLTRLCCLNVSGTQIQRSITFRDFAGCHPVWESTYAEPGPVDKSLPGVAAESPANGAGKSRRIRPG